MDKKALIVVDMQNDFVNGVLGSEEAKNIISKVVTKVEEYQKCGDDIIFTMDTHDTNYLTSQEGKLLPVEHCLKHTHGWELIDELKPYVVENTKIYEKDRFGSVELVQDIKNELKNYSEIMLIGVCTDICVVSNAILLKAFLPATPIVVDASCCAGVTKESHIHAIETMKSCQIMIISD